MSTESVSADDRGSLAGYLRAMHGYPLAVFVTCLIGWSLSNMDQSLFGYAIPGIQAEFDASMSAIGWMLTVSFIFAAIASAAIGILTDHYGRRVMFMVCLSCSALLVGLHAVVLGIVSLTVLRMFAFGIGNGLSPVTNAFVAEAAPNRYRGMTIALLQCGYPIGWFIASLFVVPMIGSYGWRYIFLPALAVIPLALLLARLLPESAKFVATRAADQQAGRPSRPSWNKIGELFTPGLRWRTLALFTIFFLQGGSYAGTAFYFPSYFAEFRGYSAEQAARIIGMSYGVGVLGYIAVAVLGEFYMTRRNVALTWTFLGLLASLGLLWLPQNYLEDRIAFGIMAAFLYAIAAANTMLIVEAFPTRVRATAVGFAGSLALNIGFATFPVMVASAIQSVGWQWAFTAAIVPPLLVAIAALASLPNTRSGLDVDDTATAPQ